MEKTKYQEMYAEQFTETEWKAMGGRIKDACKEKGYKLADLARFLGIETQQMYRISRGMNPCKSEYIYEISQLLDISTDELFFGMEKNDELQDIMMLCRNRSKEELRTACNILKALWGMG